MILLGVAPLAIELEKNTTEQENIIHIAERNNVIKAMLKNVAFIYFCDRLNLKGVENEKIEKSFFICFRGGINSLYFRKNFIFGGWM